ncbi:MAG: Fumble domain-containing protein [Chloroflexota bacterium]
MDQSNPTNIAAVDFGITNTDVVVLDAMGNPKLMTVPSNPTMSVDELHRVLQLAGVALHNLAKVAVTGGKHRLLPDHVGNTAIIHVNEIASVGAGGLHLSGLNEAVVMSAGTGTSVVAARGKEVRHISGTAVGGGTLLGLSQLLLNTTDIHEIEALASRGDSNGVDLSIADAIGSEMSHLPKNATAVNFGRAAHSDIPPSRKDIAAGLMTLVAQTIALIAVNAARAEQLSPIVVVGHLIEVPSIRKTVEGVGALYRTAIVVPPTPGHATALGALSIING